MRKKRLVILIIILFLILPIVNSIWTIPNTSNFAGNNEQEEFTKFNIEIPKLSGGQSWKFDGVGICTASHY